MRRKHSSVWDVTVWDVIVWDVTVWNVIVWDVTVWDVSVCPRALNDQQHLACRFTRTALCR